MIVTLFFLVLLLLPIAAPLTPAYGQALSAWPRDKVFVPSEMFKEDTDLDKVILESNPRLYIYKDFDPKADHLLIVGMDGWGGRSENFIDTMRLGLKTKELTRRLLVAAIQDPLTRGPKYQGQGEREHANVWSLESPTIPALELFITKIGAAVGSMKVYFMGYSTGSVAAPRIAAILANRQRKKTWKIEGAISLGTGSNTNPGTLKRRHIRLLMLVVPHKRDDEVKAMRYDQGNRMRAERDYKRLHAAGVTAYLRHITSARRHIDWHWGLMSQCRYFRTDRIDDGRGYWPNYWMPNPDTWGLMAIFLQGKEPPMKLNNPPSKCPLPSNPNAEDENFWKERESK